MRKPVAAVRWNGRGFHEDGGAPGWLVAAIRKEGTPDKTVGAAMRMRDEVHIGTPVGIMIAMSGDWIVRMDDESIWPMTDYERVMNLGFEGVQS